MNTKSLNEKQFLIHLALIQYNRQYGKKFKVEDCDIASIPPNTHANRGYEIISNRLDDNLRLRLYVYFADAFNCQPYRLEVSGPTRAGELGDEVYVTNMRIDDYYRRENIYKFRWLNYDVGNLDIFIMENGQPFITETGNQYFLTEAGV